jgi:hypothetical protein
VSTQKVSQLSGFWEHMERTVRLEDIELYAAAPALPLVGNFSRWIVPPGRVVRLTRFTVSTPVPILGVMAFDVKLVRFRPNPLPVYALPAAPPVTREVVAHLTGCGTVTGLDELLFSGEGLMWLAEGAPLAPWGGGLTIACHGIQMREG